MNIFNPELLLASWYLVLGFYLLYFWFVPMMGMLCNQWARQSKRNYWIGALSLVGLFHGSAVIAGFMLWYIAPYAFPGV